MRLITRVNSPLKRRGVILVLFAFMLVMIFGFVAFSVDVGYMTLVQTQLQNVADSAAMAASLQIGAGQAAVTAAANAVAAANTVDGVAATLNSADVELGIYDLNARTFTLTSDGANAVRVTARVSNRPLFFAPVIGTNSYSLQASAISMLNPRDIVFCIDLSGSMNDDSEPCWATTCINSKFASSGYGTIGDSLLGDLYSDFGYGAFPGTLKWIGYSLGVTADSYAYAQMTKDNGPLTAGTIAATYRILNTDTEATRKTKAYSYIIDKEIAVTMPLAKPTPSSSSNFAYWSAFLDYILASKTVSGTSSSPGMPRKGSTTSVTLPPSQDSERITSMNNPNTSTFPGASSSLATAYQNQIGYRTYVQFMMDFGRDRSPDVSNSTNGSPSVGTKTPLSTLSANCPYHTETTAGGTFSFPPREQPTHAMRRAVIAAIQEVKTMNANIPSNSGDWVSVVSFDAIDSYHAPKIEQSLTGDFTLAMTACTKLQAVGDISASTATENGLILAKNHLKSTSSGGAARSFTTKIMVLITDGVPNLYQSSSSTISSYMSANPNADWYSTSSPEYNSVLMQTSQFNTTKGKLYSVGMGLGCDYNFMDRIARMGKTADSSGLSTRGSGNPAVYEDELAAIFQKIIRSPGVRLVK